jgi:hypothetical protein
VTSQGSSCALLAARTVEGTFIYLVQLCNLLAAMFTERTTLIFQDPTGRPEGPPCSCFHRYRGRPGRTLGGHRCRLFSLTPIGALRHPLPLGTPQPSSGRPQVRHLSSNILKGQPSIRCHQGVLPSCWAVTGDAIFSPVPIGGDPASTASGDASPPSRRQKVPPSSP